MYGTGAAYVFTRSNGIWQQQAYVKASNTDTEDEFGIAVALSADGNTLAIGAPYEDSGARRVGGDENDNSMVSAGAVYVFIRNNGNWQQQAYVKAGNTDLGDHFGNAVALSVDGSTLAVGARFEDGAARGIGGDQDDNGMAQAGAIYIFRRSNDTWRQQAYVKACNTDNDDGFGGFVALSADGNTMAVGAGDEASAARGINGDENDNGMSNAGAVYLY
jgi:AICAR transformylase/IMP cyclohydrolase PurH